MTTLTVAAVQAEPVVLDAKASIAKAAGLVQDAAQAGARFVVFPETFVPCYAQWAHAARFDDAAAKQAFARLARESVRVPQDLGAVADAARRAQATVVLPVTERDPATPGTLFNSFAVFGPDGAYLGKHRKLVPTHHERTVYGYGGGATMKAFEHDGVRFGGLVCWNNYMPLARHALYRQGVQVYVAPNADDSANWTDAMRFIAREGRVVVVSANLVQRKSAFPADWELADDAAWQAEPEWNERGGSCIVGPTGDLLAGPVFDEETILTATVDLDDTVAERLVFDAAGHYGRDDVLRLHVSGLDDA